MKRRETKQREAILGIMRNTRSHPTADDVYCEVRKDIPNISKGTVYRNLQVLQEMGLVTELNLNGTVSRFEVRRGNHYHFRCEKCDRVFDVDLHVDQHLDRQVSCRTGFKVSYHQLEFRGLCNDCQFLLSTMESAGMSEQDILMKDLLERKVFYVSCKGAWRQLPEMLDKLSDYSSKTGIKSLGPPSGFYHNTLQDVAVNDLIWEVCYPVGLDTQEHFDERSKTGVKRIPAARVATIIHEGSYRKTAATYEKLQSWINANDSVVYGPAEEVYLTDINRTNGEQRIEIRLPVFMPDISGL